MRAREIAVELPSTRPWWRALVQYEEFSPFTLPPGCHVISARRDCVATHQLRAILDHVSWRSTYPGKARTIYEVDTLEAEIMCGKSRSPSCVLYRGSGRLLGSGGTTFVRCSIGGLQCEALPLQFLAAQILSLRLAEIDHASRFSNNPQRWYIP